MMLPVLRVVFVLETALGFLLISKVPPLEKLACYVIDMTKSTRGSAVTKTLAGTLLIFMASSASTYLTAQSHIMKAESEGFGHIDHAESFVLRSSELESVISGFIMLLALFINRVHYYLRGKRGLTQQLEVLKKQSKGAEAEYLRLMEEKKQTTGQDASESESHSLKVIADLREKVEQLQKDLQTKEKETKAAEANAQAIRKQSEGMALEYERLLEDNESLRTQVSSFDRQHSRSASKKDT